MNGMITNLSPMVHRLWAANLLACALTVLGLALLGAAAPLLADSAGAPPAALVEQLRAWHYGQSREPLDALQKLVANRLKAIAVLRP